MKLEAVNPWSAATVYLDTAVLDQEAISMILDDDLLYELEGLGVEEWFTLLHAKIGAEEFGRLTIGS